MTWPGCRGFTWKAALPEDLMEGHEYVRLEFLGHEAKLDELGGLNQWNGGD